MPEMGRSQSPTPSEATSHHSAFGPYNNNTNNNAVGLGMGGMGGMGGSMISDKYPDNVSVVDVFESITSRTNFWCIQISKSPSIFQAYTRAFVLTRSVFKHLSPTPPSGKHRLVYVEPRSGSQCDRAQCGGGGGRVGAGPRPVTTANAQRAAAAGAGAGTGSGPRGGDWGVGGRWRG